MTPSQLPMTTGRQQKESPSRHGTRWVGGRVRVRVRAPPKHTHTHTLPEIYIALLCLHALLSMHTVYINPGAALLGD
jgi:hypothetical protein